MSLITGDAGAVMPGVPKSTKWDSSASLFKVTSSEIRAATAWAAIQADISRAFQKFSCELLDIHARGLNMTSCCSSTSTSALLGAIHSNGSPVTARDAVSSLLLLCMEVGTEAERLSVSLRADVSVPIEDSLRPVYRRLRDESTTDCISKPIANDSRRACKKLQRAEEELMKAQAGLSELIAVFGDSANVSILKKANERVDRAKRLKESAYEEVNILLKKEKSSEPPQCRPIESDSVITPSCLKTNLARVSSRIFTNDTPRELNNLRQGILKSLVLSWNNSTKALIGFQKKTCGHILHYLQDIEVIIKAGTGEVESLGGSSSECFTLSLDEKEHLQALFEGSGKRGGVWTVTGKEILRHDACSQDIDEKCTSKNQTVDALERSLHELQVKDALRRNEAKVLRNENIKLMRKLAELEVPADVEYDAISGHNLSHTKLLSDNQGGEQGELHRRAMSINVSQRSHLYNERERGGTEQIQADQNGLVALQHDGQPNCDIVGQEKSQQLPVVTKAKDSAGNIQPSPPVSTFERALPDCVPIGLRWLEIETRYEAFLLSLQTLPRASLSCDSTAAYLSFRKGTMQHSLLGKEGYDANNYICEKRSGGGSLGKTADYQAFNYQWDDMSFASILTSAIEVASDAALPPVFLSCCKLASRAALRGTKRGITRPSTAGEPCKARLSIAVLQQQIQQNRKAYSSGKATATRTDYFSEEDLQMLAYELVLLSTYHYSQYVSTGRLLASECEGITEVRGKQNDVESAMIQRRRQRHRSFARGRSFRLGAGSGPESEQLLAAPLHKSPPSSDIEQDEVGNGHLADGGDLNSSEALMYHPFSFPVEEWERKIAQCIGSDVKHLSSLKNATALKRWATPNPVLQEPNVELLQRLLLLARLTFGVSNASSNKLVRLLIPGGDCCWSPGGICFLHPMDLRFRVVRLMEAWAIGQHPVTHCTVKNLDTNLEDTAKPKLSGFRSGRYSSARLGINRNDSGKYNGTIRRPRSGDNGATLHGILKPVNILENLSGNHGKAGLKKVTVVPNEFVADELPLKEKVNKIRLSETGPVVHENQAVFRDDAVYRSFVVRQLQLLYAAALSRFMRFFKFFFPKDDAEYNNNSAKFPCRVDRNTNLMLDHAWCFASQPIQHNLLYAREKNCTEEEAFVCFLRSLLFAECQTSGNGQPSPNAVHPPAFLLYSPEDASSALKRAGSLEMLPLRLLECFYHIFLYIGALQRIATEGSWGDDLSMASVSEIKLEFEKSPLGAGTGEAFGDQKWRIKNRSSRSCTRSGSELLRLLLHQMNISTSLDTAIRSILAEKGRSYDYLVRLAEQDRTSTATVDNRNLEGSVTTQLDAYGEPEPGCASDASEAWMSDHEYGFSAQRKFERGDDIGGKTGKNYVNVTQGRSNIRRPTLKLLRKKTLRNLVNTDKSSKSEPDVCVNEDLDGQLCIPCELSLSAYWLLDVPLLLSLSMLLMRCCTDPDDCCNVHLEAPSLTQGLLLVLHAARAGSDPTILTAIKSSNKSSCECVSLSSVVHNGAGVMNVSLQAIALLLAACVWCSGDETPSSGETDLCKTNAQSLSGESAKLICVPELISSDNQICTPPSDASLVETLKWQRKQQILLKECIKGFASFSQPKDAHIAKTTEEILGSFMTFLRRTCAESNVLYDPLTPIEGYKKGELCSAPVSTHQHLHDVNSRYQQVHGDQEWLRNCGVATQLRRCATRELGNDAPRISRQESAPNILRAIARRPTFMYLKNASPEAVDRIVKKSDPSSEYYLQLRARRLMFSFPRELPWAIKDTIMTGTEKRTYAGFLLNSRWIVDADWWVLRPDVKPSGDVRKGAKGEQLRMFEGDWMKALRPSETAVYCFLMSAILPSRLEDQQQELATLQILSMKFLRTLHTQLEDMHCFFEPPALKSVLSIWRLVVESLLGIDSSSTFGSQSNTNKEWQTKVINGVDYLFQQDESANKTLLRSTFGDFDDAFEYADVERFVSHVPASAYLPMVLKGPTLLHDLVRFFIVRSLTAIASREMGEALRVLQEHVNSQDSHCVRLRKWREGTAQDPSEELLADAEEEQRVILDKLANGVIGFVSYIQSILLLYSSVFSNVLPLRGEFPFIVLTVSRRILAAALQELLKTGTWSGITGDPSIIPMVAGGHLLSAMNAFEELDQEVRMSGVCFARPFYLPCLLTPLAPPLRHAFNQRLENISVLLRKSAATDFYEPIGPPEVLFSSNVVDSWNCVYALLEAAVGANIPIQWVLPSFLKFFRHFISTLCSSLVDPRGRSDGEEDKQLFLPLLALQERQEQCFASLLFPSGRDSLTGASPLQAIAMQNPLAGSRQGKKKRAGRGWAGRMSEFVAGVGGEEESAFLSATNAKAVANSGDGSDASSGGSVSGSQTRVVDGNRSKRNKSVLHKLFGRHEHKYIDSDGPEVRNDAGTGDRSHFLNGVRHDVNRISLELTQLLASAGSVARQDSRRPRKEDEVKKVGAIQQWLVRLHNVRMSSRQLPIFGEKLIKQINQLIKSPSPRGNVIEALKKVDVTDKTSCGASCARDVYNRSEEYNRLCTLVKNELKDLQRQLNSTSDELCGLASLFIVYQELQYDIFVELYNGEDGFSGSSLERIVDAFPTTVENFFAASPDDCQDRMAESFIRCFIKTWCLFLVEWGYSGRVYTSEDIEVLENDLNCLKLYAELNEIDLKIYSGTQSDFMTSQTLLDRVNDFLVMLDADGSCLSDIQRAHAEARRDLEFSHSNSEPQDGSASRRGVNVGDTPGGHSPGGSAFVHTSARSQSPNINFYSISGDGREDSQNQTKKGSWSGVGKWMKGVYNISNSTKFGSGD